MLCFLGLRSGDGERDLSMDLTMTLTQRGARAENLCGGSWLENGPLPLQGPKYNTLRAHAGSARTAIDGGLHGAFAAMALHAFDSDAES